MDVEGRQPYTLAFTVWEHATSDQQRRAFLLVLDFVLEAALRAGATFEVVAEEIEEWPKPWAHPSQWGLPAEEWDSGMGDLPRVLRWGMGCLGFLFKPLFWLGIAKSVPLYKVRGPLSPSLAEYLRRASESRLVVSMRLEQNGRPLWEFYDYGAHWLVWLSPEDLESLTQRLRPLLGVPSPLESVSLS